jgi:hypothetical protein
MLYFLLISLILHTFQNILFDALKESWLNRSNVWCLIRVFRPCMRSRHGQCMHAWRPLACIGRSRGTNIHASNKSRQAWHLPAGRSELLWPSLPPPAQSLRSHGPIKKAAGRAVRGPGGRQRRHGCTSSGLRRQLPCIACAYR